MATIKDALTSKGSGPFSRPVRCTVLARGEVYMYKGRDGSDKKSLTLGVCDGVSCVKVVCFDEGKFQKLATDNAVVLREIIVKNENGQRWFVLTKNSKVFVTAGVNTTEEQKGECGRLVNPPAADVVAVKTALASPKKTKVSIMGKIVQEEDIKIRNVRGQEIPIKDIFVEDDSGKCKVTLWRDATSSSIRPGDFVTLTDLVTNEYNNEVSLNSTSQSMIKKTEAPLVKVIVKVEIWSIAVLYQDLA